MKYLESIVVAAVMLVGVFIAVNMQERWNEERMQEIRRISDHKNLIMKSDSANAARFKILQDSLTSVQLKLTTADKKIDVYNRIIRKQNEQLEKIYNGLPDHGRPDF
jgi:uncharacterized membrane protein YhiD involved in acid resistance